MALLHDFVEGRLELITPTIFTYEIVSAINIAINRKRIREEAGYRAIIYITSIGIELRGFNELVGPTFYMARQYGLSPYDCAYMALAEKEKCNFFTGDKKL
jgi:predicted nucleic acid-binding protein